MKKCFPAILFLLFISFAGFSQVSDSILITTKGDTLNTFPGIHTFYKAETAPQFPGGTAAWNKYLQANLNYPMEAINNNIQGTVILQFIVCTNGAVCNVKPVSGPKALYAAAIAAMRNTPNWIPATQNGRLVQCFARRPFLFKME